MSTLKDIANKLGVTVTTVSKSIKGHPDIPDKTRKRVLMAVKEMKYIPNAIASNLRLKRTKFIGLIMSDITNPYFAKLVKGAEEEITNGGYQTIIFNNNEEPLKEIKIIKELLGIKAAGIIITPAMGDSEGIELLRSYDIPFVLANRYINKNKDCYAVADDLKAGYIGTDYLIKRRFKKVIYINSFEKISSAKDRRDGFKKALKDNGLLFNRTMLYSNAINQNDGYEIAKVILNQHKPPFSILCYSDFIASGVIKYLIENEVKIPEEVAVLGIDNLEIFSFLHPALSSVGLPKLTIGRESAKLIINLIEDSKLIKKRLVFEPKITIRESA